MTRLPSEVQLKAWRWPRLLIWSIVLHVVVLGVLFARPTWWVGCVVMLALNHLVVAAVGLWPRSQALGPTLVRLYVRKDQSPCVALTFDDGPDPDVTPAVLRMLAQCGAKATFFCIGERAQRYPEICRQIVAAGHEVANHGQRHPTLASLMGRSGWLKEVSCGQETLRTITGVTPRYYRAVAGLRNPMLFPVLAGLGIGLAAWTRRGFDTRERSAERVLERLLRDLRSGDILLLHDGNSGRTASGEPVVLAVLPRLLDVLVQRGYRLVRLSD